jgi:hypothetical protein
MAYTKKKSVYINFVSPIGIARFPKIDAPDTTGQYADNKYKTELVLSDADTKAFKATLQAAVKQLLPNEKNVRIPMKTSKKDGVVSFIFKSPQEARHQRRASQHRSFGRRHRSRFAHPGRRFADRLREPWRLRHHGLLRCLSDH